MKRFLDILISSVLLIVLSPLILLVSIFIKATSKGPIFFKQIRVGLNEKKFNIFKFRTMYLLSEQKGQLTVGGRDIRITNIGYYLRKYKLDELPQLLNVLAGDMSLVGPRPEVPYYVAFYSDAQRMVFTVKPGITDYASIEFAHENDLLLQASDPEQEYIHTIMPAKLAINLAYVANHNLVMDFRIIFKTITKIWM